MGVTICQTNERLRVGVALAGAILLSVPRVPPGEGAGGRVRVQERVLVLETQTREPRRAWGAHALTGLSSFVRRSYSCSAAGRRGTVGSEPDQDNGRRSGALQRLPTEKKNDNLFGCVVVGCFSGHEFDE